jgi:hypothetical protein
MARSLNSYREISPRTARGLLVPEWAAADAPGPVREANAEADARVAEYEQAAAADRQAREALRAAPGHDRRAAADAVAAGEELPAPTEPVLRRQAELAGSARKLCAARADQAIRVLHDRVGEHHLGWLDKLVPQVDAQVAEVAGQVAEIRAGFERLAELAALERGLRNFDPGSESPKARSLTRLPSRREAERLLAELDRAARGHVPERGRTRLEGPAPPTDEERGHERTQRMYRELARGGVSVP